MIQRVTAGSVGPLRNSSDNDDDRMDDLEIPSITQYLSDHVIKSNDRYLHKISHIRLDEYDVVIYSDTVNLSHSKNEINGICTVRQELCRIPKGEFKDLIKQLMSEDE